jgi:putative membrane protein
LFSLIYSFNIIIVGIGVIIVEKTLDAPMIHLINMIWNDGGRVLLSSLLKGNFSIEDGNPDLGEHTNLPVKLLKINDCTFVFPAVHPGPFGEIGGACMPTILSQCLKGLIFTLHTPTTHDFNPIRREELDTIITSIKNAVFSERSSCSRLITTSNQENTIKVNLFVFGRKKPVAFLCLELYGLYGDVGFELWEVTSQIAKNLGYNDVFIADAHNYYTTEEKSARLGTPIGETIKHLIEKSLKKGIKVPQFSVEFASIKKSLPFNENRGFGRDGMGVFALRCGGETTVFLYFDGNSLLPDVNKKLTTILLRKFNHAIILTTDTHSVHTMGGGYNPIGKNVAVGKLVKLIEEVLDGLVFKKSKPKVASTAANIWIWSPDLGTRYLQALDTTLITGKWFLPAILGFSLLCALLLTILA